MHYKFRTNYVIEIMGFYKDNKQKNVVNLWTYFKS